MYTLKFPPLPLLRSCPDFAVWVVSWDRFVCLELLLLSRCAVFRHRWATSRWNGGSDSARLIPFSLHLNTWLYSLLPDVLPESRMFQTLVIFSCLSINSGCQVRPQIGSHWPQMGQIWDFLRSVSVHFGALRQNVLKLILKSPRFVASGSAAEIPGISLPSSSCQWTPDKFVRYLVVSSSLHLYFIIIFLAFICVIDDCCFHLFRVGWFYLVYFDQVGILLCVSVKQVKFQYFLFR